MACNGAPKWPPAVNNCTAELFGPDFFHSIYHRNMTFLTCEQFQELAESHGFVVTYMEDKDVPGYYIGSVNDLIGFLFGLLHGELDREAISEETIQNCRSKYDNDLYCEAEAHLKTRKLLHAVLTKP